MSRFALVLTLYALLALAGCNRWRPNTPLTVSLAPPDVTLDAIAYTMRRGGWEIIEFDDERRFVRASAKHGRGEWKYGWGKARRADNSILVSVDESGRVEIWGDGELVRGDGSKVHKALAREIHDFADALEETLRRERRGATIPRRGKVRLAEPPDDEPPPQPRMPPPAVY